jgi:ribosomal protein S18 acetylase RimI-like enzyme
MNAPMNEHIVQLHPSQVKLAAKVLSSAFSNDPFVAYFLPSEKPAQLKSLRYFSAAMIRYSEVYESIYTTAGKPKGVAIWLPPVESGFQFSQISRLLMSGLLGIPFQIRWERFMTGIGLFFQGLGEQQMREPHWYLAMLGVDAGYQGQGIGSALLQPILQRADQEEMPCYLETSTAAAVRFYQRHGFAVEEYQEIVPGLPYWKMKRAPLVQSPYS